MRSRVLDDVMICMRRRDFVRLVIPLPFVVGSASRSEAAVDEGSSEQAMVSFGVIADPQFADKDTKGSRFYRKSLGKLKSALTELGQHELDFVMTLGDVIDQDFKSFAQIMPVYEKLKVPHRLVLGNHDFDVADKDKGKVMKAMGMDKAYYSEVRNGWRFVYLDGTEMSVFRYPEGSILKKESDGELQRLRSEKVVQAQPWNGGISVVQLAWLKGELDAAKLAREKVIICNHYPVMPEADAHNLWNAEAVVKMIDEYDHVAVYMNGHNHKGNYAKRNGTHYVNFKGMVETEKETSYAVVKCYTDHVEIEGFGAEMDRVVD